MWNNWKEITNDTALKVLGPTSGSRTERWISENSWKLIDEWKALKIQREQEHPPVNAPMNYRLKDKQMKKSRRKDK